MAAEEDGDGGQVRQDLVFADVGVLRAARIGTDGAGVAVPASWRPHEDPVSPIRVNPLVRFGLPAVGGISTEAIAGELDGGASLEEVAGDFGLDRRCAVGPEL
jgi:hypothetical protein